MNSDAYCLRRFLGLICPLVLLVGLLSCGSGEYHRRLSAAEREQLSVIELRVEHDLTPSEHYGRVLVTSGSGGTTYRRLGAAGRLTAEAYASAMRTNVAAVQSSLIAGGDRFDRASISDWFADLTIASSRLSVVYPGGPPSDGEPPGDVLEIKVYHKAAIGGVLVAAPRTYVGLRARLKDRRGKLVYDRQFFSNQWASNPETLERHHHAHLEKFLRSTLAKIWRDIRG